MPPIPEYSGKKLTEQMIEDIPVADIHVHVPGTVAPLTAWELGVRNGFIEVRRNRWTHGSQSLNVNDPHEHYADIFFENGGIKLDENHQPQHLQYALKKQSFKSFDAIMATVQGHRHPPGGIQNERDYRLVLRDYLKSCVRQKVAYTELQQNIRIAYELYPHLAKKSQAAARKAFYLMLKDVQHEYEDAGVQLRFLHCFNKTGMANDGKTPHQRAIDGAKWLQEAKQVAPGVFVGLESAGHEKDIDGWPARLRAGYELAHKKHFGCEAHGGEGIGVEHLRDVVETLPVTRVAHGFQAIEDPAVIDVIRERGITLVMSPCVNVALGSPIHKKNGVPTSREKGGEPEYITDLSQHPFFYLLRDHHLPIALATDNPGMGGVEYKTMLRQLAGLTPEHAFTKESPPLTAEELAGCCLNAISAAFCGPEAKRAYVKQLSAWMEKYDVKVDHPLLDQMKGRPAVGKGRQRAE